MSHTQSKIFNQKNMAVTNMVNCYNYFNLFLKTYINETLSYDLQHCISIIPMLIS